jgi:hypothetical protein
MANGESTQRSQLDADAVTWVLREQGAANLLGEEDLAWFWMGWNCAEREPESKNI